MDDVILIMTDMMNRANALIVRGQHDLSEDFYCVSSQPSDVCSYQCFSEFIVSQNYLCRIDSEFIPNLTNAFYILEEPVSQHLITVFLNHLFCTT